MAAIQISLVEPPLGEEEARKRALEVIRSTYGTIPYPGKPVLEAGIWKIPIIARYPRVIGDEKKNLPEKVRFMAFEDLGHIDIDANTGDIRNKPNYWYLQRSIKDKLELIQTTVFKALIKVGAGQFSNLPLSEHIHTPLEDVISWLLIYNTLDIDADLGPLTNDYRSKYRQSVIYLNSVGLVKMTGSIVEPGNALIEIERTSNTLPQILSKSLAYFFAKGYEHIDSIKQVLGPHLIVTGSVYQRSVEYGEATFLKTKSLEDIVRDFYPNEPPKIFKLPRYLVQCTSVGLIEKKIVSGEDAWYAKEEIFGRIMGEEEILEPIKGLIL